MPRDFDDHFDWDSVTIWRRKQRLNTDYTVDQLAHMMCYLDEGFASETEYKMTLSLVESLFAETVGEIANLTCMAQSVLEKLGRGKRLLGLLKDAVRNIPETRHFSPFFLVKLSRVVAALA